MRASKAFITLSVWSYISLSVFSGLHLQLIEKLPPVVTLFGSALMAFLILATLKHPIIGHYSGAVFGFFAMGSFSGILQWHSYYGKHIITGPYMAAWDIAIGLCMIVESDLHT